MQNTSADFDSGPQPSARLAPPIGIGLLAADILAASPKRAPSRRNLFERSDMWPAGLLGLAGLRLADSSVFPRITDRDLDARSIKAGKKASDHILGRAPLPRANAEP